MNGDDRPIEGGGRTIAIGLGLAGLGWIGLICGWVFEPTQTFASYLTAYAWVLSLAIGMLLFIMSVHAMDAGWPVAIRRVAESATATLPLIALLFIPLFFGLRTLYPFMRPETVTDLHVRQLLAHKRAYLNLPFFCIRAVVYLVVLAIFGFVLRHLSIAMDQPGARDRKYAARVVSCIGLPLCGLIGTFAAFDWLMALSPDWYSTMFGLYYLSGGFIGGMALLTVMVAGFRRAGRLEGVGTSHFYGLGRILFAFLIFWAYIAFFQFLLVWIADKPIEARWYVDRIQNGHRWVGQFLIFGHFAAPFFCLLSYWVKRHVSTLVAISVWLVGAHYFDVHWLVQPAFRQLNPFSWLDLAAVLALGGLVVAFAALRQRGRLIAPVYDPKYEQALGYESV